MPWPIPDLQLEPLPRSILVRDIVLLFVLALLLGALFGMFSIFGTPSPKFDDFMKVAMVAATVSFWLLSTVLLLLLELPLFRAAEWNLMRILRLRDDQQWTHNPLALIASHVLLPEPDVAARLAGLEAPPLEAATAKQTLFANETLAAGPFRFERICKELLQALAPQIRRLGSPPLGLETVVWLQCNAPLSEREHKLFAACWQAAALPRCAALHEVAADAGPTLQARWRESDHHSNLLLAMHYHADEHDSSPEGAVALLLTTGWRAAHSKLEICNQLYRPCSLRQQHFADDFRRWAMRGQQPRNLIGQLWLCGLDKTQQHSVKTLATDLALPLRQNPPAFGVLDPQAALGIKGVLLPWLSLALASELVACQQGSQAIAYHHGKKVWMQMTGMAEEEWQPFGGEEEAPAVPLLGFSLLILFFAALVALLPGMLPPDPDNSLLFWLAGLLVLLAFGAPFLYAYLCRERWRYQFALEVHDRTPAKE